MSGWPLVAIGVLALMLLAGGVAILFSDVTRGAIGGRQTRERARRFLVVVSDEETRAEGVRWGDERRRDHPDSSYEVLQVTSGDERAAYLAVAEAAEAPQHYDAVVVVRHGKAHGALDGVYGRLKEELSVPVDAIYVSDAAGNA